MPLIIITIIIVSILLLGGINKATYSNETLLNISKSLTNKLPLPYGFPIITVRNKEEFNNVWEVITDKIFKNDVNRNVIAVNQWSYYAVKYYTESVLQYGNRIQKKQLRNFVRLIDHNRLI